MTCLLRKRTRIFRIRNLVTRLPRSLRNAPRCGEQRPVATWFLSRFSRALFEKKLSIAPVRGAPRKQNPDWNASANAHVGARRDHPKTVILVPTENARERFSKRFPGKVRKKNDLVGEREGRKDGPRAWICFQLQKSIHTQTGQKCWMSCDREQSSSLTHVGVPRREKREVHLSPYHQISVVRSHSSEIESNR